MLSLFQVFPGDPAANTRCVPSLRWVLCSTSNSKAEEQLSSELSSVRMNRNIWLTLIITPQSTITFSHCKIPSLVTTVTPPTTPLSPLAAQLDKTWKYFHLLNKIIFVRPERKQLRRGSSCCWALIGLTQPQLTSSCPLIGCRWWCCRPASPQVLPPHSQAGRGKK